MGKEAVPALRGVSLEIQRGEIVCLMGPSGSGKTTLLNIIGGLDEPSRGHVIVEGVNLVPLNENQLARLRLQKMGFMSQKPSTDFPAKMRSGPLTCTGSNERPP
jgi:putative ABC transport system ATP-binding protein